MWGSVGGRGSARGLIGVCEVDGVISKVPRAREREYCCHSP